MTDRFFKKLSILAIGIGLFALGIEIAALIETGELRYLAYTAFFALLIAGQVWLRK